MNDIGRIMMNTEKENNECVLQVNGLSKKFCRSFKKSLIYAMMDVGRELTLRPVVPQLRRDEFWVIDDVSFNMKQGESLGIIGANGAGKSTLLKLLTGIIKPTKGSITMSNKVQALIELGSGMNPVLTGRENIFINGAVLGIPKEEITKSLDKIIDFSELGEFIDMPVQNYSSGMKVRLGFSIAVHIRPEILMIDEVLAVGDQVFRRKARKEMDKLLSQNVALIFISHNLHEVLGITKKAIWLEKGRIKYSGPSNVVCAKYAEALIDGLVRKGNKSFKRSEKISGDVLLDSIKLFLNGEEVDRNINAKQGECYISFRMYFKSKVAIDEKVLVCFYLKTYNGVRVGYSIINDYFKGNRGENIERIWSLDLGILHTGNYILDFAIVTNGGPQLEYILGLISLTIKYEYGKINQQNKYNYERMTNEDMGPIMISVF